MANTNFLPEDYIKKKTQRRTNIISLTLFVVVMVGIVGAFLVTDRQRAEVLELQTQVNKQFEEAAKRLEQLDYLQQRKEEMLRKAKVTAVLIERVPRSLILAELINQMPSTLSLLDLDLKTKVIQPTARPVTALDKAKKKRLRKKIGQGDPVQQETLSTLQLVGVAPTDVQVAQFMTSLGRSDMFTDVNLAFSEEVRMKENQPMRKFRIDLKLNQDVDVQALEPKLVKRELKFNPINNTIQIDASGKLVVPTEPEPEPDPEPDPMLIQALDPPQPRKESLKD